MRVGEALALTGDDVDLAEDHAHHSAREVRSDAAGATLHPSVTVALRDYVATRDRLCPTPRTDAFFVSAAGGVLRRWDADRTFRTITKRLRACAPTPSTRAFTISDTALPSTR